MDKSELPAISEEELRLINIVASATQKSRVYELTPEEKQNLNIIKHIILNSPDIKDEERNPFLFQKFCIELANAYKSM